MRALAADLTGGDYRQPNDQTAEALGALKARGWFTSWFVRHPIRRFLSVYHLFQTPGRSRSVEMRVANSDGDLFKSIEMFAERAFNDFPCDKHIAPQTGWGAEQCELIAPLYCANEAWQIVRERAAAPLPEQFPQVAFKKLPLPPINTNVDSQHYEAPPIVHRFYKNDLTFWEKVCADFHPENIPARRPNVDREECRQEELVRPV